MSLQVERIRGRKPELGRQYYPDFARAVCGYMTIEETDLSRYLDNRNIQDFGDYMEGGLKVDLQYHNVLLDYAQIVFEPTDLRNSKVGFSGRFGVLMASDYELGANLYDGNGQQIISRRAALARPVELHLYEIQFPNSETEIVMPPSTLTASLRVLAEYLMSIESLAEYVYGLTNPRMANLSRRWGFEVVRRPFHQDVYDFVTQGESIANIAEDEDLPFLKGVVGQSLVYQATDRFIARFAK